MKRQFDGMPPGKRRTELGECRLSLLIHHKAAGAIIGKGGENIKRLRSSYDDIEINIPDSNSPERVLNMVGSSEEQVVNCLRDIMTKLDEVFHDKMHGQDSELRILVHASHAGAVIGRAGFKIKELREECNTEIKVFTERAPFSTDRCIRISGMPNDVIETVIRVLGIVNESPIKGPDQPYDSSNYDPNMVDSYGGYQMDGTWRGPVGRGGGMAPPAGGRMGPPGGFGEEDYRGGRGAQLRGPGAPGFGGGRPGPSPMFGGGPTTTTQVTIPDELAGVVIGKGGQRIAETRLRSGAEISIDSKANEANERIITITGTQNSIQMAQYLLQQTVRSSSIGRQYIQEQLGGQ